MSADPFAPSDNSLPLSLSHPNWHKLSEQDKRDFQEFHNYMMQGEGERERLKKKRKEEEETKRKKAQKKNPILTYGPGPVLGKRDHQGSAGTEESSGKRQKKSGSILKYGDLPAKSAGASKVRPILDYRAANYHFNKKIPPPRIIYGGTAAKIAIKIRPQPSDYVLGGLGKPEPRPPTTMSPDEKKAFRREFRSKMFGDMLGVRDQTILEKDTVYGKTRAKYLDMLQDLGDFLDHCVEEGVVAEQDLDAGAAKWLGNAFLAGEPIDAGNYLVAATQDKYPRFKKAVILERVERAMKGWRRLSPSRSRQPVPKVVIGLLCERLVKVGRKRMACCVWLGMEAYLRPGELCRARRRHLLQPLSTGGGLQYWNLQPHPADERISSKTLMYDEGATFDLKQHNQLHEVFQFLKSGGGGDETLLGMTYAEYHRSFMEEAKATNLIPLYDLVPYICRHVGASRDRINKTRTEEGIMKVGRWRARSSMLRYDKAGQLLKEASKLAATQQRRGEAIVQRIGDVLMGRWAPWLLAIAMGCLGVIIFFRALQINGRKHGV